ncbi:MAG: radical SAM family heme chaperone HemW [Desulfomonilaceae bacterium]
MQANAVPGKYPDDCDPIGVYVHIPFCLSRCDYCGFVSYPFEPALEAHYVEAVIQEFHGLRKSLLFMGHSFPPDLDTIYFGGGTPSVFNPESIERIIDAIKRTFNFVHPIEITVEVNPGTYSENEFLKLQEAGVNRISIGAQSLNNLELRSMNRRHSRADFIRTFINARKAGFHNISVDLLAGYPGQTLSSIMNSLEEIIELGPEHVSVYMLEIKSGSKIENRIKLTQDEVVDDDLVADMYEAICEKLCSTGFEQYEISNFSRIGMQSRHNLKYWTDQVFLGVGLAAHGMTGRTRYSNVAELDRYLRSTSCNQSVVESLIEMDPLTRFKDTMIMGLRLTKGVDLALMSYQYGLDASGFVKDSLGHLDGAGLFTIEDNIIKLTQKGRLLSNIIFSQFI